MPRRTLEELQTLSEEELLRTLGLSSPRDSAGKTDPLATIEPNRSADTGGLKALQELAQASAGRTLAQGLEVGTTLGEGGMGIVRLAVQRSLGREVAVKTLRPTLTSESAVLRLVREAWVTGSLEHPNIVPVYDLAIDTTGAPTIVLRRIEGETWDRLMHAPEELARRFGVVDPLEWNLGILSRVASAVSLAHSRGIVHRDLKPENVMIGSFGEVYVLDWGVAVSLKEDPEGRLPTSSSDVAGTPAYMAPEMFGLTMHRVSERSDVYLLGGMLYEILTGHPPHPFGCQEGREPDASVRAMLVSASLSKFPFPDSAPKPLVGVAEQALAAEPSARFASAADFQKKVEWYVRHRGSLSLSLEADARARELDDALTSGDGDRVHRIFAECRFGYRAALRASPDNGEAQTGLRRVTEAVARFELARNAPQAAAGALAEISDAPPELEQAVAAALRAAADERARFLAIEQDQSRLTGRRTRRFVAMLLGVLWALAPILGHDLELRYSEPAAQGHTLLIGWSLLVGSISCAVAFWARDSLLRTAVNRRFASAIVFVFAAQLALQLGARHMGLSVANTVTLFIFTWFLVAAFLSVLVERRVYPAAIVYLLAFVAAAAEPTWRWAAASVANLGMAVVLGFAWRARAEAPE